MLHVGFLNKNLYRKYPLRAASSSQDTLGRDLPLTLLSGCKLSVTSTYIDLFISKIYISKSFISITISKNLGSGNSLAIGYCNATITKDYQAIPMAAINDFVSGFLVFGQKEALNGLVGTYNLDYRNGQLEASTITCITTPAVRSITSSNKTAKGEVTFVLDNISEILETSDIDMDVINTRIIQSLNDTQSSRLNCKTNIITAINGVTPDDSGNIDVFGILPVRINVIAGGIGIDTPGITPEDICPNLNNNIPPMPLDNLTTYPTFPTATDPEYKTWPQYAPLWEKVNA